MTSDVWLKRLARDAWTDAESMQVLVDHLLADGLIQSAWSAEEESARASWFGTHHRARDHALYRLECAAREWILLHASVGADATAPYELRVTGAWPEIEFVVWQEGDRVDGLLWGIHQRLLREVRADQVRSRQPPFALHVGSIRR